MKETLQIAAYRRQMIGNIHGMFRGWIDEAVKHSIIKIQNEIIKNHYHAREGWGLAGTRLNKIKELEEIIARKKAEEDYAARPVKEPLTPIAYLELPRRVRTVLRNQGFQSIGDVIDNTEFAMRRMRGLGKGGLAILKAELARHGETLRSATK